MKTSPILKCSESTILISFFIFVYHLCTTERPEYQKSPILRAFLVENGADGSIVGALPHSYKPLFIDFFTPLSEWPSPIFTMFFCFVFHLCTTESEFFLLLILYRNKKRTPAFLPGLLISFHSGSFVYPHLQLPPPRGYCRQDCS